MSETKTKPETLKIVAEALMSAKDAHGNAPIRLVEDDEVEGIITIVFTKKGIQASAVGWCNEGLIRELSKTLVKYSVIQSIAGAFAINKALKSDDDAESFKKN